MTSDTELVSLAIKMIKKYCTHGIVAGTASGAAFGVFVLFVVSPQIAAIESAHASGFHSTAESTLAFSTLFTIGGSTVWRLILGLIFSLLYYIFENLLPGSHRSNPFLLAGAGFVTVSGVPWLLLPPSVEPVVEGLSQSTRTLLYFGGIGAGAVTASTSLYLSSRVTNRGTIETIGISATPFAVTLITGFVIRMTILQPTVSSYNWGYAATVVLGQLLLWLSLAGIFSISMSHRSPDAVAEIAETSP